MYRFSAKIAFGIEALVQIAERGPDRPIRARELNKSLGLPPRYLESVLQILVREGVIYGVRGPRGGYILDCDPHSIRLSWVAELIRETEGERRFPQIPNPQQTRVGGKVWPLLDETHKTIEGMLDASSIADLMPQPQAKAKAAA